MEKFQHFVSRMQLKRFVDADGKLQVWNKRAGKLLSQAPGSTFGQTHLYTTEDKAGEKDTWFEKELSALEAPANILLTKIEAAAEQELAPQLSEEEKALLDFFFYTAWKRVPDFFNHAESIKAGEAKLDEIFAIMRHRHPDRAAELNALNKPEERKRLLQGGKIRGIATVSEKVVSLIAARGLMVLRLPPTGDGFVIGSFPVVRTARPLTDPEGEVWLPISPRLMIGPGHLPGTANLAEMDPSVVLNINRIIANQSTMFAGPDRAQIESLSEWLKSRTDPSA
jgi:Protein of unknown function (DUF4238)